MNPTARQIALAYAMSGILHVGAMVLLIVWLMPARQPAVSGEIDTDTTTAPTPSGIAIDDTLVDDAMVDAVVDDQPSHPSRDALADADVGDPRVANFMQQKLQQARDDAASLSTVEQMDDLESLSQRLSQVASEASVAELADAIGPLIGSRARSMEPVVGANEQPFDVSTAQISDVLKQQDGERTQYMAVLIDAAGRTQETPLEEADGESLYGVFQLMKKFPLLEAVYRKTVMGLLDRLIEEEQTAGEPTNGERGASAP